MGKLGFSIDKYIIKIMSEEEFLNVLQIRKYRSVKYLDDGNVVVSYNKEISKYICENNNLDYKTILFELICNSDKAAKREKYNNVSIATASAITAYSRIYINKIKLDILSKGGQIYYSDTDSIVTDIKLNDSLVGPEIGKFKLEHEVKEGYFISNKTYSFINKKGKTIFKNKGVFLNKDYNKRIILPQPNSEHKSLVYENLKKLYLGNNIKSLNHFYIEK